MVKSLVSGSMFASYYDPANIAPQTSAFTIHFVDRIALSKLYQLIQNVSGVVRLTLTGPEFDIEMAFPRSFPLLAPSIILVAGPRRVDLAFEKTPATLLDFQPVR